jgi:tRNA pseudouridine13 synthase
MKRGELPSSQGTANSTAEAAASQTDAAPADAPTTSLPVARIREKPSDFVVEELPAYPASGSGDHLFVTLRKTGLTTPQAVRAVAAALELDARGAGFAGMKDRHAVTTQTISLPIPADREIPPDLHALAPEGIELLVASRHQHKLKSGHLAGNRFRIVLRGLSSADLPGIEERLRRIAAEGLPNAFGRQRFGRHGDNATRALSWLRGEWRGPRHKDKQRLLFSALQSHWFNQLLAAREQAGNWATVVPGDLAKKHETGGLFLVEGEPEALAREKSRAASGEISATGPMFGAKMRWPEGEAAELERVVLDASGITLERLAELKRLGAGTRRALRLWVDELSWEASSAGDYLTVSFVLPKGRIAERRIAERRIAERRIAERRIAERRIAERRIAERRIAQCRVAQHRPRRSRRVRREPRTLRDRASCRRAN